MNVVGLRPLCLTCFRIELDNIPFGTLFPTVLPIAGRWNRQPFRETRTCIERPIARWKPVGGIPFGLVTQVIS